MAGFPASFLEEIRARLLMSQVAGRSVKLTRKGTEYVGLSPFGKERTPSFTVNDQKRRWFDFHANKNGDVFSFLVEVEGMAFPQAVEECARLAGIPMPAERRPSLRVVGGADQPPTDDGAPPWAPDDAPGPRQEPAGEPGASPGGGRPPRQEITRVWPYEDSNGTILYEVCRIDFVDDAGRKRKRFAQRRPLEGEPGRYVWGLGEGVYVRSRSGDFYLLTDKRDFWTGERREFEAVAHSLYPLGELLEARALGDDAQTMFVCYAGDTEVLTPRGWVLFPELAAGIEVAQWDMATGDVSFAVPSAHQDFAYAGDMVHVSADWCDLLVTPDHRQPTGHGVQPSERFANRFWGPKVKLASDLRQMHRLPVAGSLRGLDHGPTVDEARLIAAWLGDGVQRPTGTRVLWNLKKERKKARLRDLLTNLGLAWSEQRYSSTPGWTSFWVSKRDLEFVWSAALGKQWGWSAINWSFEARAAALDEICYWDGDRGSGRSSRFFTAERQSADVITAMAAVTNVHAAVRVDRRSGRENFVVSLNAATWRVMSKTPTKSTYNGRVYCCTVPTGFLIVRRNGKVTISGNCEGEKKVDILRGWGLLASTNSGGSGVWRDYLAAQYEGLDVVVIADNDKPGRAGAHKRAASLRGVAKSIRLLDWREHWPACPEKGSVDDWVDKSGGNVDDFFKIIAKLRPWTPPRPESNFGAFTFAEIDGAGNQLEWLVKNVLVRRGTSTWFGPPGCGKSFLVTDLAMAVARGISWMGRRVNQGLVIYAAVEGGDGFKKRMRAYRQARGMRADDQADIVILPQQLNIYAGDDDVNKLIAEARAWQLYYDCSIELLVVDTLAAAAAGYDENAGKDLSVVLQRCRRISAETGAHVLLVHHSNAAGGKARGHTSLIGNVDSVFEVVVTDEVDSEDMGDRQLRRPVRQVWARKIKDAEAGWSRPFVLKREVIGRDADGDDLDSCVIQPVGADPDLPARGEVPSGYAVLRPNSVALLKGLVDAVRKKGVVPPQDVACPSYTRCCTVADWQEELRRVRYSNDPDDPTGRRVKMAVKKAVERTYTEQGWPDKGFIGKDREWVWRGSRPVVGIDPPPSAVREQPKPITAPGESEDDAALPF